MSENTLEQIYIDGYNVLDSQEPTEELLGLIGTQKLDYLTIEKRLELDMMAHAVSEASIDRYQANLKEL